MTDKVWLEVVRAKSAASHEGAVGLELLGIRVQFWQPFVNIGRSIEQTSSLVRR